MILNNQEEVNIFLKKLTILSYAVSDKDFQPAMKCILFTGSKARAYNGELFIEIDMVTDFQALVPVIFIKFLVDVFQFPIEIITDDHHLIIKNSEGSRILQVGTLPFLDFPPVPTTNTPTRSIVLISNESTSIPIFISHLASASKYVGKDEIQQIYRGIYITENTMYATDGFIVLKLTSDYFPISLTELLPEAFCQMILECCRESLFVTNLTLELNITPTHFILSVTTSEIPNLTVISAKINVPKLPNYESIFESTAPFSNRNVVSIPRRFNTAFCSIPNVESSRHYRLKIENGQLEFSMNEGTVYAYREFMAPFVTSLPIADAEIVVDQRTLNCILRECSRIEIIEIDSGMKFLRGLASDREVICSTIQ